MNTNAELNVRMPNKVIFVETFDELDIVGTKNTLYIVRDENDQMYEYIDDEYRALTTKGDLPPGLTKEIEELKNKVEELSKHPLENVADKEVHGIRFKNGILAVTDDKGNEHQIEGGGNGGGEGHGYKQVTKLGVTSPKEIEITIPHNKKFLRPPIEVLSFTPGEQDIEVGSEFDNESADDFEPNEMFVFSEDGFTLCDNIQLSGEVVEELEENNITSIKLDVNMEIKDMEVV